MRIATAAERPDLAERGDALAEHVWPEYNRHGDILNEHWNRLGSEFPDLQFVLYDEEADDVLAQAHTIPCRWDGTAAGLPAGIDAVIAAGEREGANVLSALAIEILPAHQGRGLSSQMIAGMAELARAHGLGSLIAPIRPSWKERYPLTPIERYARWARADGLPFDPWLRVHHRLGAEILRPEPQSLRITGTIAEWEAWTDMPFPESGDYVFPRGLATLEIDLEGDAGRYWEPNVWMMHPL